MALPNYAFFVDDKSCSGIGESEKALADMESLVGNVFFVAQDRILYAHNQLEVTPKNLKTTHCKLLAFSKLLLL
jgi:hypothetical protein